MTEMLITMTDGGLVSYRDDSYFYSGCPTCDYGSEYINDIDIELTHYKIYIKTNQMYEYALSEGQMMQLFLRNYNLIQTMTEMQFIDWLKTELGKIIIDDEDDGFRIAFENRTLEKFEVEEV